MVISDKIETTTIATDPGIDEATILEIRTTFVSPFQSSLTTAVVVKWRQINLPKSVPSLQSFCFDDYTCCLFIISFLSSFWLHLSSLLTSPRKIILDMRRFFPKKRRFDGKRATKSTFRRYSYRGWQMQSVKSCNSELHALSDHQTKYYISARRVRPFAYFLPLPKIAAHRLPQIW